MGEVIVSQIVYFFVTYMWHLPKCSIYCELLLFPLCRCINLEMFVLFVFRPSVVNFVKLLFIFSVCALL